jgi:bacillithiol system protein YtxJ
MDGVKELLSLADLDQALKSGPGTVVLYKHSTTCGICDAAIEEVQAFVAQHSGLAEVYYLDLLEHRDVSTAIAQRLGVKHESPQAIVLRGGQVLGVLNHRAIRLPALLQAVHVSPTEKR